MLIYIIKVQGPCQVVFRGQELDALAEQVVEIGAFEASGGRVGYGATLFFRRDRFDGGRQRESGVVLSRSQR